MVMLLLWRTRGVDLVNTMERIGNHCLNTLQAISNPDVFDEFDPEQVNSSSTLS